jgi:hypothetical protein
MMIESLLLAVTRVTTMFGQQHLTNATGFFFERDNRLFVVTSRHVVLDEASDHRPDRLEIELHVAPENVAMTTQFSIPLYRNGKSIWRAGRDAAGTIDVLPDRCTDAPRHERGPGGRPRADATRRSGGPAVDAARRPRGPDGRRQPRRAAG